jgi:hypothetical protein
MSIVFGGFEGTGWCGGGSKAVNVEVTKSRRRPSKVCKIGYHFYETPKELI